MPMPRHRQFMIYFDTDISMYCHTPPPASYAPLSRPDRRPSHDTHVTQTDTQKRDRQTKRLHTHKHRYITRGRNSYKWAPDFAKSKHSKQRNTGLGYTVSTFRCPCTYTQVACSDCSRSAHKSGVLRDIPPSMRSSIVRGTASRYPPLGPTQVTWEKISELCKSYVEILTSVQ